MSASPKLYLDDPYLRAFDAEVVASADGPIVDGRVRIVEIAGFDAQACGGTHVHATSEIGAARVVRFDNKGKDNKRFYWELAP